MADDVICQARFDELAPRDLYDILQLRSDVFVVEQECVFLDLDGRDHDDDAIHLWIRDDDGVAGAVRVLGPDSDRASIGRVVTRRDVRSTGVASRLMRAAITLLDERGTPAIHLGAQAHLAGWYERFGFQVSGPGYDEDDIPHVPMRRVTDAAGAREDP